MLGICLAAAGALLAQEPSGPELYEQGRRAEKKGRMAEAYLLYSQAAALEPNRREFWLRSQAVKTRAALQAREAAGVEHGLMVFFIALAQDLARQADRQLAAAPTAPAATAQRFLEAIWRYYNLVDFAVGQRHPATSTAMRLAYDDAESTLRASPAADSARLRTTFQRIAQILSQVS